MSTSEDLREAAAYIEQHGMTKGCLQGSGGSVCMLGAINTVSGRQISTGHFLDSWMEANVGAAPIGKHGYAVLRPTAHWNDHPETTQEDVLLWMKKAANDAEEQGL